MKLNDSNKKQEQNKNDDLDILNFYIKELLRSVLYLQ